MPTANLGLTIPVIGVTDRVTAETAIGNDLTLIDDAFGTGAGAHQHTGVAGEGPQLTSAAVSDFATAADARITAANLAPASHTHAAADVASGTIATARLGSGTADATTYLRGDQTWAAVAGGGAVETFGVTFTGAGDVALLSDGRIATKHY